MDEADYPDPVGCREVIARLTSADEWDGEHLRPDRIATEDLRYAHRGWSVQRVACTPLCLAREVAVATKKDPAATEIAIADVAEVRRLLDSDQSQLFFVVPAPLVGNEAHALALVKPGLGRGGVKQRKERLIGILRRMPSLESVFS